MQLNRIVVKYNGYSSYYYFCNIWRGARIINVTVIDFSTHAGCRLVGAGSDITSVRGSVQVHVTTTTTTTCPFPLPTGPGSDCWNTSKC